MDLRGLVLLSCLATSIAAPLSSSKCDPKCIVPSGFQEGQTYLYSYHTETATYIQGEDHGYSNLTVSCQVNVEVVGTCELVLELHDVSVTENDKYGDSIDSPNVASFQRHLQAHRLRFGMQAGEITSVCPSSDEDVWVTNFKRGILSSLQLSLPSTTGDDEVVYELVSERTVSGICPTLISAYDSEIVKEKDFTRCENRFSMDGCLQGIKLFPHAPTSTIVSSYQRCRQEHSGGDYITSSVCEESHILKPMPNQEIGPITAVVQTLTFDRAIGSPSNRLLEAVENRKDILYEHHTHTEAERTDSSAVTAVLDELCQSLSGGVDADTARLYPALVHEMRRLELTTLTEVIAAATCEGYETSILQIVADALETCQSSGCVEMMVNLIQDDVLQDEKRIKSWLSSLHFIRNPTKEMIGSLMQLTEMEKLKSTLYLSLSSVINIYCRSENTDCENVQEVSDAMDFFENNLRNKCRYSNNDEKREMMLSIRAIGNAAIPSRSLRKCFEYSYTDTSLRIAAMQATMQMPCDSPDLGTEELKSILRKTSEDAELRITAYRALMTCPTVELLDLIIYAILEEEQSNQVGGYIVSHLKNIKSTKDPLKAAQKSLLLDHPITAKFLDDAMKFSRNFELSWFNETSGYGIAGESDIILSSDSFIPRQLSVKGQVDALGYAFEAFELGGRVEGLHNYLESMFNPIFPDMTNGDREKRSMIKESRLDNVRDEFEVHEDGEPDGSLYLKIFGQEVLFMDTDDFKKMMEPKDMTEYMIELAMLAQGTTYDVTKSHMMPEHSISLPLANGFNLKFATNGSSTERLRATGMVDILAMFMTRSMEIDGTVEPSFAFDISSSMEVDAHCSKIGVHFEASGHTATSFGGRIKVENGNSVQIKLRAPEQEQEILSMSSKVYFLHQEERDVVHKSLLPINKERHCTGEFLEDAMGFRVCGTSSFHRHRSGPELPLDGSYQFSLTAEKVEQDLESFDVEVSYELKQKMVDDTVQNMDTFHLMFGTPDTEVMRTYSVDFEYSREKKHFTADLQSPKHTCHVDTMRIVTDDGKHFEMTVTVDEESEYSMYFNLERTMLSDQVSYYPIFRIRSPQFGTLRLESSIISTPTAVNIDVQVLGEIRKFIAVSGSVARSVGARKSRYDGRFTIGGEYLEGSANATVTARDGVVMFDGALQKENIFGRPRTMTISGKHSSRGSENFNQDFYVSCAFSHSPQSDFRVDGEIGATGPNSLSTIKYCYGETNCNHRNKIILSHVMTVSRGEYGALSNSLTVSYEHPALGSHLLLSQDMRIERDDTKHFTLSVTDRHASPPAVLVAGRLGYEGRRFEGGSRGSTRVSLTVPGSVKTASVAWDRSFATDEGSVTTSVQWREGQETVSVVSYSRGSEEDPDGPRRNFDIVVTYPQRPTHRLHAHLDGESGTGIGEAELSVRAGKKEKLYAHGQLEGTTASLRTRTPFATLPDSLLSFALDRPGPDAVHAVVSFTSLPQGHVYSFVVDDTRTSDPSIEGRRVRVALALPASTFALDGFAERNRETQETKVGASLTVTDDEMQSKTFGVEGRFRHRSEGPIGDLLLRLNTTSPYHQNAVQLNAVRDADRGSFDSRLVVGYSKGQDLVVAVGFSQKPNRGGLLFSLAVESPFQSAALRLDHSTSDRMFNPRLVLEVTSFEVDITLLDAELEVGSVETVYGKNSRLRLTLIGPEGKTVILTTGIGRSMQGMNYHVQLANEEEVRFRLDLNATVRNGNRFETEVRLAASSVYAEDMPIDFGIRLSQGDSGVGICVDFNVDENPLFIFNITKTSVQDLPRLLNEEDLTIRARMPTSINANLHDFGFHFGRESELIGDKPRKSGSVSIFWGPATNQQLTISSTSELVNDDETGVTIDGSLVMAQPLRMTHLYPEYSLDYSLKKTASNVEFDVSYSHGNGNSSRMVITHSDETVDGITNYTSSVAFRGQQGNTFTVKNTLAVNRGQLMRDDVVFIIQDGGSREEALLTILHTSNSDEDLHRNVVIAFLHSPSGLDLTLNLGIQNSESLMYLGLEGVCDIPALESPVNLNFETEVDKLTKHMVFHMQGPVNDIILRGNAFDLSGEVGKSFRLETDNEINGDRKPLNVQINYENRAGDVLFEIDNADVTVRYGYLNDSAIQVALMKDDAQRAQATVNLLNPHTLYSLITWDTQWPAIFKEEAEQRLDVVKDVFRETRDGYRDIVTSIRNGFETYLDNTLMRNEVLIGNMGEVRESLNERRTEMNRALLELKYEFRRKFRDFKNTLSNNLQPLYAEYESMGYTGSSQMRDIAIQMQESVESYFDDARAAMIRYQRSVGGELYDFIRKKQRSIRNDIRDDRNLVATFGEETSEELREWFTSEVDTMRVSWIAARRSLQDGFRAFAEQMSATDDMDNYESMQLGLMLSPFYSDSVLTTMTMMQMRDDFLAEIEDLRSSREERMSLLRADVEQLTAIRSDFRFINTAPSFGFGNSVDAFHIVKENVLDNLEDKLTALKEWAYVQYRDYTYRFNVEDGTIEIWLYTDSRFDDLISAPSQDPVGNLKVALSRLSGDFPLLAELRRFENALYDDMPLVLEYLREVVAPEYRRMYPGSSLDIADLWRWNAMVNTILYKVHAPAIRGRAFLLGNQHYMTFDGTHYEFAGKCSYLLAQDFVDNNFTIAVEYNREEGVMSKQFVVMVDGVTVEIRGNRIVVGNRREKELPYMVGDYTTITRDSSTILIASAKGFTVSYNIPDDMLTVELSIFYYGKTAGLFGNFNFEPNDDLTKSDGLVASDVSVFTPNWEIGKRCSSHLNKVVGCDIAPSIYENRWCADTFLDGLGSTSRGHAAVNPEPFYSMCANRQCQPSTYEDELQQHCSFFSAYARESLERGVFISTPPECVRCSTSEGDMINVDRGADIVIIMEEESCMANNTGQVKNIADEVHRELKRLGLSQNRFGIVGFGGSDISEPHAQTIEGELFGASNRLQLVLDGMRFDGYGTGDYKAAIAYALNYPFRAGVAKHIILMACSNFPEKRNFMGSRDLSKAMIDQGIKFSIVLNHTFSLGRNDHRDKGEGTIYGVDPFGVFTEKHAGLNLDEFKSDRALSSVVERPKNSCAKLAEATSGTMFDIASFRTKNFRDIFAMWVVRHGRSAPRTFCICRENDSNVAQSICGV